MKNPPLNRIASGSASPAVARNAARWRVTAGIGDVGQAELAEGAFLFFLGLDRRARTSAGSRRARVPELLRAGFRSSACRRPATIRRRAR